MADRFETTARVILTSGPLVLCAGAWDEAFVVLPGGHVDGGDAHTLDTVRREVYEEIGTSLAQVRKLTVLPAVWTRGTDTVHETLHLYAATTTSPIGGVFQKSSPLRKAMFDRPTVDDLLWLGALPRSPEARTVLRWASVDDLVQSRVHLQPLALLPWVVRCGKA